MTVNLLLSTFLLHLLILQGPGNAAAEIMNHGNHDHADMRIQQLHPHTSSSSSSHLMDFELVFFLPEDLKLRNTLPIYFPKGKLSDSLAGFLSKNRADSIPFSSDHLDRILRLFSLPADSPQAGAMMGTLKECEREPIKGEIKSCAMSFQAMTDFVRAILGPTADIKPVLTTHVKRVEPGRSLLQKYRIMGIRRVPAPKMVSCHAMTYAYTVYFCHYQGGGNGVYSVSLTGENGDEVEATAVCHMDTSEWSRNHVSFKVLGVEPGTTPVCHFFPADNFVWVPNSAEA